MALRQRKLAVFAMESVTFEKVPEWSPKKRVGDGCSTAHSHSSVV